MKDKRVSVNTPYFSHLEDPFRNNWMPEPDPLGSYTGTPIPPDDEPVQDADDL